MEKHIVHRQSGRGARGEGRGKASHEPQFVSDEPRATSDGLRTTSDEGRTTVRERRATSPRLPSASLGFPRLRREASAARRAPRGERREASGFAARRASDERQYFQRGQSVVEYAVLVVIAAAALVGMFSYVRSAMAYRLKSGADGIGHGMTYYDYEPP